jgi:alkylation response protein AidB-like acyl-CoA dehydrogenase
MDFSLNEDQTEIARQARRFFENECPMEHVRTMFEDERGFTDEIWAKMAELGWMGMRIPEEYGGIGLELIDLAVVLGEMGRAAAPGPFFSTVMLAAEVLIEMGNESQKETYLTQIAAGEMRATMALNEPESGVDPGYIQLSARLDGDDFVLNGIKLFVPDAHVADLLVCAARTESGEDPESGITLFLVDPKSAGVGITPLATMDGTRKLSEVRFDDARVSKDGILGDVNKGWGPLRRVIQRAQVGLSAENVGGAERAMEIAVDFAKIRYQFGQPIGSFQAIKHRCADMLREVEGSRSVLYWAAWAQDHGEPDEAALSAAVAKAYTSESFKNLTAAVIQVLGGVGFTWEHDIHLYFKRAKSNEVALGDPAYQKELVARMIGC